MPSNPAALWDQVFFQFFQVHDDDWPAQVPRLRELARLIQALIAAVEESKDAESTP